MEPPLIHEATHGMSAIPYLIPLKVMTRMTILQGRKKIFCDAWDTIEPRITRPGIVIATRNQWKQNAKQLFSRPFSRNG